MMFPAAAAAAAAGRDEREPKKKKVKRGRATTDCPHLAMFPKLQACLQAMMGGMDIAAVASPWNHGRSTRFLSPSLPCLELACLEDVLPLC